MIEVIEIFLFLVPYLPKVAVEKLGLWITKYYTWQWKSDVRFLWKHGTVRELREYSQNMKQIAETESWPTITALANEMHGNAERLVLQRIGL